MPPKSKADLKKAEQDRLQALVMALLREEENKYCADCDGKQPRWASWNLGVFICIRCAGIHRNLGVHVSKVKSVNLDSWTGEQVQSMRVMGNAKAKAVYEAELPEHFRRPQSDQSLESFIRAKYEHKRYVLKNWQPPKIDVADLPAAGTEKMTSPPVSLRVAAPAGRSMQVSPKAAASTINTSHSAELLDFSAPAAPIAAQSTPSLLDFSVPAPSASSTAPAATASNNDLDDIFGGFVSAPTATSAPAPAPEQEVHGAPADLPGDLSALSLGAPVVEEKKSTNDILALFGNMPKVQVPQQPVSQQQPQQHHWGAGLFGQPAAQQAQNAMPQMQMQGGFPGYVMPMGQQQFAPQQQMQQGGFGMMQQPVQQPPPPPAPTMNTTAFDSLSFGNLFPGGASSFNNSSTAAAFAAASPFNTNSVPPPLVSNTANSLNLDSLL